MILGLPRPLSPSWESEIQGALLMMRIYMNNHNSQDVLRISINEEYQPHTGEPVVAYKLDDVPEDIRNKVAVLQIGEDGHAIMDVGVKVTPTTFWVFES